MDITFNCDKCGQNIEIDEAGAGITIDCPKCGSPVYVPSRLPPSASNGPIRIETTSARAPSVALPVTRPPSRPASLDPTKKREGIHPSIVASLQCLIIGTVLFLVFLLVLQKNLMVAPIALYMATPFLTAAPLCAIYGMCVGHVKQGLLLLAAMSLGIGISYWAVLSSTQAQFRQLMH